MLRGTFIILLIFFLSLKDFAQQQLPFSALAARLDSISSVTSKVSHFAELYLKTTIAADMYIQTLPSEDSQMMKYFEMSFAEYFFRAVGANEGGVDIPAAWKNYFSGKNLSSLQLRLIGANAHINGDISQALINSFSLDQIKKLKPCYKKFSKTINKVFSDFSNYAIQEEKKLRHLHSITLGFDKVYGKMMLRKWRNRQLRLAILYFEQHKKFERVKKRVANKREKIDRMIIKRLS